MQLRSRLGLPAFLDPTAIAALLLARRGRPAVPDPGVVQEPENLQYPMSRRARRLLRTARLGSE